MKLTYDRKVLSNAQTAKTVSKLKQTSTSISFVRDKTLVNVQVNHQQLNVQFTYQDNLEVIFPVIGQSIQSFVLPIMGQGKFIPSDNKPWLDYLTKTVGKSGKTQASEGLSMPFVGGIFGRFAAVYILHNYFNSQYWFENHNNRLTLYFMHQWNTLNKDQSVSYDFFITKPTITDIAKTYKQQISDYVTLEQKAKSVPDINKLIGAPFIYLWGDELIGEKNIQWHALQKFIRQQLASKNDNAVQYFAKLGKEKYHNTVLQQIAKQKSLSVWDKANFENLMIDLVQDNKLYNKDVFNQIKLNTTAKQLLQKKDQDLNTQQTITLNKALIQSVFSDDISPVAQWGNGVSLWMLNELQSIGLKHAWLGLDDRLLGSLHQNVIKQAVKDGYLIAPYDSYSSIQLKQSWSTAHFQNNDNLYQKYTIQKQNGSHLSGFLNRGRVLNSSFSMPEVKYRLKQTIVDDNIPFNSWFFDTDGTGMLYHDFSPSHPMTKAQDAQNRLKRMAYAANTYHLVVGTENGDAYSAPVIAYGHGNVTAGIWDKDMRQNKKSRFYMGAYYAPLGIPPRYAKPTPLKPIIETIHFSPQYSIPLYQLVFHNSVIVSDHWEYGTFKFPQEITNNIIKTFLYDYPPLLHLDRDYWIKHKKVLSTYLTQWQKFSLQLSNTDMTDFTWLNNNKLLQQTTFSNGIKVIANFANQQALIIHNKTKITLPAKSLIAFENDKRIFLLDTNKLPAFSTT